MPPRKTPRLQGKKYLITYPKCTLTKDQVLEALKASHDLEEYTVAHELHEDGTPHIHACVILSRSPNTTNMRHFDIAEFHPNIKVLKTKADFERATRYCQKDGDFVTNIEKRLGKRAQLFKALLDHEAGLTPKFVRDNPEIMGLNFEGLRKWISFVNPLQCVPKARFLPKKRHIWVHGPTNSGKSYFLTAYQSLFNWPQELPLNNDYVGINPDTDFLYRDEFRGHLSIQEINRICDGRTKLNTKGGTTIIAYPLLFIVSNYSIEECYRNCPQNILDTVHARFNQYDFTLNRPKFPTCEL